MGRRNGWRAALVLALSVLACLAPLALSPTRAARSSRTGAPSPRKFVLVIIDRIGLEDLTLENAANILELIDRGEVALMNARVRYDPYGLGGYVVIGAGGRAFGGLNSGLAFNRDEKLRTPGGHDVQADELYYQRTGRDAPPGSVLNLYIEEMKRKSDTPQASSLPGLLGQALREAGRRVAVLGNADSLVPTGQALTGGPPLYFTPPGGPAGTAPEVTVLHREATCIAMDGSGMVPAGDVGASMYRASRSAAGVTTDFDKLVESAREELSRSDVLVVDMGQTARVDDHADFYSDRALKAARGRALGACDAALGRLLEHLDLERDVVAVCVPTPTRKMLRGGDLLTPVVFAGNGFSPGERLSSPTTRRAGLVSSFDIAPTALDLLGIDPPAEMDGRPLGGRTGKDLARTLPANGAAASGGLPENLAGLREFERRATGASVSRRAMVRLYAVVGIAVALLFLLVSLVREEWIRRRRLFWSAALMSLLAGPLAYLVAPAFAVPALYWLLPVAVLLSVLLALCALFLGRRESVYPLRPLMVLSGATALVILIDVTLGSRLMTFSPFGSDVMMADRYYGVGNLCMGFAIGSALLFGCLAAARLKSLDSPARRFAFCAAVFGATAFIVGFGRLGANFGGLIAALAGGGVALMKLEGGRVGVKKLAVGFVVLAAVLALTLAADVLLPGNASHAGRALSRAESGGGSSIVAQAGRKLTANWNLTWSSIWRLLLLALAVTGLGLNWKHRQLAAVKSELPAVYAAFCGLGTALPVALLLNDSGIEAAVAIAVFLFVPILLMLAWRLAGDASLPGSNAAGCGRAVARARACGAGR